MLARKLKRWYFVFRRNHLLLGFVLLSCFGFAYADEVKVEQISTTCFLTEFPDQFIIRFEDSGEDTWDILFVSD